MFNTFVNCSRLNRTSNTFPIALAKKWFTLSIHKTWILSQYSIQKNAAGRHYLFYVFIYLTLIKYLQWTRNYILLFKKFKAVKYGPRWEVTKSSQKGSKLLTPKILLCNSAEDQNPQNQGKPQDGDAPAKDQGKELGRASPGEQPGDGYKAPTPASHSALRHRSTSRILVDLPPYPPIWF